MAEIARRRLALAGALIVAVVAAVSVWAAIAPPSLPAASTIAPERVVPSAPPRVSGPPAVEPLQFKPVTPQTALEINSAIPFSTDPNPAAAPFRFAGSPEDRARATDCLAAATYYEAGADTKGRAAVAQVILNRLRHPAFPKTVCGVVFQGSERKTGCQFTFTCDGALARAPAPALWEDARKTATAALSGTVFAPVGHATHYHTDWVTPYWSESLDKIAAIETHLFFRWKGWWGTPRAFASKAMSGEPVETKIAGISGAHKGQDVDANGAVLADAAMPAGGPSVSSPVSAGQTEILFQNAEGIAVLLSGRPDPASFPQIASSLCGARSLCKVRIWTDRRMAPARYPIEAQPMRDMAFSYLSNPDKKFKREQWNCRQFQRQSRHECLNLPFVAPAIS